jgi:flagellar protein FliO/FliZ
MDNFGGQLASTLLALVLVSGLAWVCIALLRRIQDGRAGRSGARPEAALRFVRAMPVGPKERVVVVHYRGEELLLGVTPGGIHLLTRHPFPSDDGASSATAPAGETRPHA